MELGPPLDPVRLQMGTLWRFHERVTFEEFSRLFLINKANSLEFPIIDVVLKNESQLPLIKFATDILAWHAVIFKVLKPGSVTREQAGSITNEELISRFESEEERCEASAVLDRFCVAFNSTITLPGNLKGCAPNIYVSSTGEIDLGAFQSSIRTVMNRAAPIAFSIPNSLQIGLEFVDPRGLCTIFILDSLRVRFTSTTYFCIQFHHLHPGAARNYRDFFVAKVCKFGSR